MSDISEDIDNIDDYVDKFTDNLKAGQVAFQLFDCLPDVMFWMKDLQGRFLYVNKGFILLSSQTSKKEIIGKTDHDIFPVELASIYRSDDIGVISRGKKLENKSELLPNATGGVEWRETTKIPLYDIHDKISGTAGIARCLGHSEGRPSPSQHRVMNAIIGAIYKCVDQEIKVTDLATAANISVSTLERVFKQNMGTTPKKFILQAKISTACERLIRSSKSVRQIGRSIGYPDHANFTRAFKKLMGVSPSRYKELYGRKIKLNQDTLKVNEFTDS